MTEILFLHINKDMFSIIISELSFHFSHPTTIISTTKQRNGFYFFKGQVVVILVVHYYSVGRADHPCATIIIVQAIQACISKKILIRDMNLCNLCSPSFSIVCANE